MQEMLLSAACTVINPQIHHPRLSKSEAQELLNKSFFRHTEKGSFVLKVSSPVNAMEHQESLFGEANTPFVRQTTLVMNTGLYKLVEAIERDTLQSLVDEMKVSVHPEISSNLCKAIISFQEEYADFNLDIDFSWAITVPVQSPVRKVIKIQRDYFSRIDEVHRELRNTEEPQEETFVASVEGLEGEIGSDNRRRGEVTLKLYQEDEIIRAKASLDADDYEKADDAHMNPGRYVVLKGRLHPGKQPRRLTDISVIQFIPA